VCRRSSDEMRNEHTNFARVADPLLREADMFSRNDHPNLRMIKVTMEELRFLPAAELLFSDED